MTDSSSRHLLLVGLTTRALAQSAAKAGYRVTALDGFGDLDLRAVAEVRVTRDAGARFSPAAAGAAAADVPSDFVAYTSNLENYPDVVAGLAADRTLLGNAASVLKRVRNPIELTRVLRAHGLPCPAARTTPPPSSCSRWLLKRRRSGGGHGVSAWHPGMTVPGSSYLQEWIDGIPGSVTFAASRQGATVLGVSRQLVGDPSFGASGFRYCGSILAHPAVSIFPHQAQLFEKAAELAAIVTREFGLKGLNGIDFMAQDGVPYPIEVNPRYSASMELVQRADHFSLFLAHLQSCMDRVVELPHPGAGAHGKAVVFARRNTIVGDTGAWMTEAGFADVPHPGEHIMRGRPICTAFAAAPGLAGCIRQLRRRAESVYRATSSRRKRVA